MVNVVISMQNTSPPLWNTDCFWIASWNTWAGNQSSVAFSGFADYSATFLRRDVFTLISVLKDKMRFYVSWSAWKASNFFFFSFLQISRNFVLSVRGSLSHPCTVRWSGRCYSVWFPRVGNFYLQKCRIDGVIGILSVRKRIFLGCLLGTNLRAWIHTHSGNSGRRWLQHRALSVTLRASGQQFPAFLGPGTSFMVLSTYWGRRLASWWFGYVTFIVRFISNPMPPLIWQEVWVHGLEVGDPWYRGVRRDRQTCFLETSYGKSTELGERRTSLSFTVNWVTLKTPVGLSLSLFFFFASVNKNVELINS